MIAKLITIITITFLYGFFEFFMSFWQKRKSINAKSGDKGSIWLLTIFIGIGYFLSFNIGATKVGRIYHWDTFFIIGLILIVIGLIIRITSINTLKKQFTYTVKKIENHELIETGLYRNIRHPGYLGQLIILLGISTCLSNWLSIILMMGSVLIGYTYRMKVEEKFMIEQMGQKYLDYKKRTKRLIPRIY